MKALDERIEAFGRTVVVVSAGPRSGPRRTLLEVPAFRVPPGAAFATVKNDSGPDGPRVVLTLNGVDRYELHPDDMVDIQILRAPDPTRT